MTKEEWDAIISLVEAGEQESPWGWSGDWPKSVSGDRVSEIVEKFKRFAEAQKGTTWD